MLHLNTLIKDKSINTLVRRVAERGTAFLHEHQRLAGKDMDTLFAKLLYLILLGDESPN